ncbi:2,7-anhydro-N-acetylneuraminate hydratase-like isoform X6 [Carettochelys insculpta]|uniref:2,7-anhydro-N-acetylneuraminate hydratase-like isoform X6 n=1 Tax=Carettochelys insculpta TaxID=44489 RepID=UPI003EC05784
MTACVTVLIIGAGCRGKHYSCFAVHFPSRMKVVGVADPHTFARNNLQKIHNIDKKNVFNDWKAATERERFADAVVIATPDRLHKAPAIAFANKGYHILLEKPMAVTPEDCKEIASACKANNVMLAVCHVLRYYPASLKIKELLDAGAIGDICHIQHLEPIGFWHFAHSFVRGNWRNEAETTFSLLAKSCHDIDLINFWMGDKRCLKVSSFGSLSHFTNSHKPKGAASRCLDCSVEQTCPYSAKKIYLKLAEKVVNMEFEGGATAAFTMMAFTERLGTRKTTVYGTKENKPSLIQTGPEATLQTHLLVFEAEKSRKENRVVFVETRKEHFP